MAANREISDPYVIAYLNGGTKLAVLAALTQLYASGAVRIERDRCSPSAPLAARGSRLERAILSQPGAMVLVLPRTGRVRAATAAMHDQLHSRELLWSPAESLLRRAAVVSTVPLALLPLALLGSSGTIAGFLIGLGLTAAVGITMHRSIADPEVKFRTPLGNRVLAELRTRHPHLAPSMRPDWTANGPSAAALSVALYGVSAIRASDRPFATALGRLAEPPPRRSTSSGSHPSTYYCGGGSGCGSGSD